MSKNTKTAKQAYAEQAAAIQTEIAKLQAKLAEHAKRFEKNPGHWGYVGDLDHIRVELADLN